ncbi:pyridoxal phosphate-dependent aminotransferase [Fusobacterium sp. PH5-44]|uniref:pyridoxal phosphate-dependent aminotransferase n=1 Tax=unclassified Fusobacterium TaxID=2648384 RepID=UPI003D1B5EB7
MLRKESKGKKIIDGVFAMAQKAKEAKEKFGDENVINATVGSLYDENGKLVVYKEVIKAHQNQTPEDYAAYASAFTGSDEFKEAVKISVFGRDYKELTNNHYLEVLASPGGTGAISNTIHNYLNEGDTILLPEWMWSPYKQMAKENKSNLDTYMLFDENENFNLKDFGNKVEMYTQIQENLVIIINDPCQNPTGYKLSVDEWENVFSILEKASKNCDIILINDIAYFDYDKKTEEEKLQYRSIFFNRPSSILTIFAFSISKSITSYGMRVGAQLAISTKKEITDEFKDACAASCRATWSNVSRGGMQIFSDIILNEEKSKGLIEERDYYVSLIKERADIFIKEAQEVGLAMLPYKSGFFLTVPTNEMTGKVAETLINKNIFTIVLEKGIRIAVCSIPKSKMKGLAKKIKDSIEESYDVSVAN